MIIRIFNKATFVIFFLLLYVLSQAQSNTSVKMTPDKNRIMIGEPLKISFEADIPENEPIRFFHFDSIPHFEFLNIEKIDTSNTGSGTILTQVIYITSFDSGHWVIPPFVLGEGIVTDSIPVDVVFSAFDPQQAYHDVKDIIEVNPEEEKKQQTWWWYAAGGALLLILLLVFLLRTKKKPVIAMAEAPPDPYQEAVNSLGKLRAQRPEPKEYYSQLVDIFRVYLARRKGIHSLQKTTDDLVVQLQSIGLPADSFTRLSQSLRLSDFVKFAKYEPTGDDDEAIYQNVAGSIEYIEKNTSHEMISSTTATNMLDASKELMSQLDYVIGYSLELKKMEGGVIPPFALLVKQGRRKIRKFSGDMMVAEKMYRQLIKEEDPEYAVLGMDSYVIHQGRQQEAMLYKAYERSERSVYNLAQRYILTENKEGYKRAGTTEFLGNEKLASDVI